MWWANIGVCLISGLLTEIRWLLVGRKIPVTTALHQGL